MCLEFTEDTNLASQQVLGISLFQNAQCHHPQVFVILTLERAFRSSTDEDFSSTQVTWLSSSINTSRKINVLRVERHAYPDIKQQVTLSQLPPHTMRQWTLYSSHKAAYFKSNTFWFFSWKSYHILLIWDVRSEVQWDSRASALTIVQSRHWLWLGQASLSPSLTQILITFQLWGVMSLWAHFFPVSWGNAHFSGHHSPAECTFGWCKEHNEEINKP